MNLFLDQFNLVSPGRWNQLTLSLERVELVLKNSSHVSSNSSLLMSLRIQVLSLPAHALSIWKCPTVVDQQR